MTSRRFFLKSSGLALVSFGLAPQALVRSVYAAGGERRKKSARRDLPARRGGRPQHA